MKTSVCLPGLLQRMVVLTVLLVLSTSYLSAQTSQQQNTTKVTNSSAADPVAVKGLSADGASYVTATGKKLAVGQSVTLGTTSDKTELFAWIFAVDFIFKNPTQSHLKGVFTATKTTIEKFKVYLGVTYVYFKINKGMYAAAIEAAVSNQEIIAE